MPIHDSDWSLQFFAGIDCPDDVHIPAADSDAWQWFPAHNWIYDKLRVAQSQGMACAPHGVVPAAFPVFSKPITNMYGMGAGSRVLADVAEYHKHTTPGHFWMPLLNGDHVSTDVAVLDGRPVWWRHAEGVPAGDGMFDYWTIFAGHRPAIEDYCDAWIRTHLAGYSGMLNFETIGARIIEGHLRFADQWPDINGGRPWVEALVRLYAQKRWDFADAGRRDGYSVALFGPNGRTYLYPPAGLQAALRAMPGVSSLQLTFHEDEAPEWHSNPPGGFRIAVINCWDLAAGIAARQRLADHYGLTTIINETSTVRR